jgi:hypothetical protein
MCDPCVPHENELAFILFLGLFVILNVAFEEMNVSSYLILSDLPKRKAKRKEVTEIDS